MDSGPRGCRPEPPPRIAYTSGVTGAEEDRVSHRQTSPPLAGANLLLEPGTWDRLRLAWRLFRDPRVASKLKTAVPVLTLLYVLSPIDLLPDVLLGLGQLDDVGAIGLALIFATRIVPRLAPAAVLEEHMAAMGLVGRVPGGGTDSARDKVVDARFRVER